LESKPNPPYLSIYIEASEEKQISQKSLLLNSRNDENVPFSAEIPI
jgi:hypothetical protein